MDSRMHQNISVFNVSPQSSHIPCQVLMPLLLVVLSFTLLGSSVAGVKQWLEVTRKLTSDAPSAGAASPLAFLPAFSLFQLGRGATGSLLGRWCDADAAGRGEFAPK
ncbi:hypothetical protein DPEC_G00087300 [Dallia pectoralis]|uniref:Uncharacterized protein n=1 Tax=Dallia pectoralis TaxID=75939 RepID=A0ACC2GZS9_DALPE|nr:hypothetical protein DPEC_G00087300 [Dallia pectoralis]